METPESLPISHIKVDIEGDLFFEDNKLTHDKIIEFFKKLDYEKLDDSTYQLKWIHNNLTQRVTIVPEDTLFIVKDVVKEGSEVKLVLNDETLEKLEPSTLEFVGNIPYAMIKRGRIKARFNRNAAYKLGLAILG